MSYHKPPIFNYLLIKLAARCNIECTYCYWFRDDSVYEKPKVLTEEAEIAVVKKLEEHINRYTLKKFSILFHGGEPLLIGKKRFVKLVDRLKEVEHRTKCSIHLSITTNGTLIDKEWATVFRVFNISPALSIDGPKNVHDSRRIDFVGNGTYEKTIRALKILRENYIEPGVLAVCDPRSDPTDIVNHFVKNLKLKHFDILVPDATHEDKPESISEYYKTLFDIWYDNNDKKNTEIRYVEAIAKSILGGESHLESIGYGPIQTCIMLTDGSLEPLDVLRIAGYESTKTELSIFNNTFQDIVKNPIWQEAFSASLNLCDECNSCKYKKACGGGFLPHRWSNKNRYDNTSVYCKDLIEIFDHASKRIFSDLKISSEFIEIPLNDALTS